MEIRTTALVRAKREHVEASFWAIKQWAGFWDPMQKIDVVYEDELHQEVIMIVDREGDIEHNRTIRFRDKSTFCIDFFSPIPPPMMTLHKGKWRFEKQGMDCLIIAERAFSLCMRHDENLTSFHQRSKVFSKQFADRLARILQAFKEKIELGGK